MSWSPIIPHVHIGGADALLQLCSTERSTYDFARFPADLAQAPDGGGKLSQQLAKT